LLVFQEAPPHVANGKEVTMQFDAQIACAYKCCRAVIFEHPSKELLATNLPVEDNKGHI